MKNLYSSLFILAVTFLFSCKKEESKPTDSTKTPSVYTGTNNPSDYPFLSVDHNISVKDNLVKAGDTVVVSGVGLKYLTKKILINGDEVSIESFTDTTITVIVPDLTSGKMEIVLDNDTTTVDFYYADLKCEFLKKLSISNFIVTQLTNSEVRYTFDLTNNSGAYLDFSNMQGGNDNYVLQNYVQSDLNGTNKSAAGGTVLRGAGGVKSLMSPGEVFQVSDYAVEVDNYLQVDIHGYIDGAYCSDSVIHIEKLDLNF